MALALQNYEMAFEVLPPATANPTGPIGDRRTLPAYHVSRTVQILPHLELSNVYRRFDSRVSVYDRRNRAAQRTQPSVFACPSAGGYSGCHAGRETPIDADNDGCLYLNSAASLDDVPDGCGNTML